MSKSTDSSSDILLKLNKILEVNKELKEDVSDLKERIDSLQNQVNVIQTNYESTGAKRVSVSGRRHISRAINVQWKDFATSDGKTFFQHVTCGPDEEWLNNRSIGTIVKHQDNLAKIETKVDTNGCVIIRYNHNDTKKKVNSNELEVQSLWPFETLGNELADIEAKDTRLQASINKAVKDDKIKLKANTIWSKVLKEEKHAEKLKWLKDFLINRNIEKVGSQNEEAPPSTKPTKKPAKSGAKPAAKASKPAAKSSTKKKVKEEQSDSQASSSDED